MKSQPSCIERDTSLLLDPLEEAGCKATFFTLGWVPEHHPQVLRLVAGRGHEVSCHRMHHRTVFEMTASEFREDTRQAKQVLEECTGVAVQGYRTPSFSITQNSLRALEILVELGFTYDISRYRIHLTVWQAFRVLRSAAKPPAARSSSIHLQQLNLRAAGLRSRRRIFSSAPLPLRSLGNSFSQRP